MLAMTLAAGILAAAPAGARPLTVKEVERLEQGWPILILLDGDEYLGGSSYILLEQDIDTAWNAIQDPGMYSEIYPTVHESKVVGSEGDDVVVKMVHGNKVVKAICYLSYRADSEKYKLTWRLAKNKKSDVNDTRGSIRFSRYKDGRTLLTMSTVLDIGNDFIEKMFGDRIIKGLLYMPYKFRKYLERSKA
jgi:hypothetical protein